MQIQWLVFVIAASLGYIFLRPRYVREPFRVAGALLIGVVAWGGAMGLGQRMDSQDGPRQAKAGQKGDEGGRLNTSKESTDLAPDQKSRAARTRETRTANQDDAIEQAWREAERIREEERCRQDLRCWAKKHKLDAQAACMRPIESLAKYDYKWIDTWDIGNPNFSRVRWRNQETGVITYLGDDIKFQNGFGAWIRHTFACTYRPATGKASAEAYPGRLD